MATETNLEKIELALAALEGAVEGIMPFYPRVARYMNKQIDTLYRAQYLRRETTIDETKLSNKSKPGWEEVDAAIAREMARERLNDDELGKKLEENEPTIEDLVEKNAVDLEAFYAPSGPGAPVAEKRGRGRPKKHV